MKEQFGRRLMAARIAAEFEDAADAALAIGVEAPRYRKYERGEAVPPLPVLALICTMFGVTADFLLLGRSGKTRRQVCDDQRLSDRHTWV